MKKIILAICLVFAAASPSFSQELEYGLSAGVNYAMSGQITETNATTGNVFPGSRTFQDKPKIGFHGGVFLQVNFGKFFIRPEVIYTSVKTEYEFPSKTSVYSAEKIDVPLLFGYNVFGPFDVYAGPVISDMQSASLMGSVDRISVQNSRIDGQVGVKVEFGRLGLDIRYEKSFSSAKVQPITIDVPAAYGITRANFDDARINQIIVSVIFKFGGPGLNEGRGNYCY